MSGSPAPNHNHASSISSALSEAIRTHRDGLSDKEKYAFENAQHTLTETQLFDKLRAADQEHEGRSILRKGVENMQLTFGVLKRLSDIVSIATSANPIATIVLGTVRVVFEVALGILNYFDKLSGMIAEFAGLLEALTELPETPVDHKALQNARVRVYGDFLRFCQNAYGVYVDNQGRPRKWTTASTFVRSLWKPFEAHFAGNMDDLKKHVAHLNIAATGTILATVLEAKKQWEGTFGKIMQSAAGRDSHIVDTE